MSTLTVTTINTVDSTTNLTVSTGNTNSSKVLLLSGGGLVLQGNSSTNTITVQPNLISTNAAISLNGSNGTQGQVLTSNGSSNVYWSTTGAGTVTSVGGNGSVSGLTLTGTVTSTGNLVLGGTISLPISGISATGTANNTSYLRGDGAWSTLPAGNPGTVTSIASGNGINGGTITSSGTLSIQANTGLVSNADGLFVNSSYISTLTTNNVSYVDVSPASSIVNSASLTANLSFYQSLVGLNANVATLGYMNTSSNYTISGIHTHTANTVLANTQIFSIGVGTAASGSAGEIRATNNITAYYSSDRSLKENIVCIPNALNKVKQINGVEFDWTDAYIESNGGADGYFIRKHDVGVVAQEIESVLPEVVATREDGIKAVKYDRVVALLIEAIKDLEKRVAELEAK